MSVSVRALLHPASIAIVGASSDPGKLGSLPLAFLVKHGYRGTIYPVHPKEAQIAGIRCWRSIAEIDATVDLLVIAVAADRVLSIIDECRPDQVKSSLILSSGFAESGEAGALLQARLRERAAAKGIRFIGPNSVGCANLFERIFPSISQVFDQAALQPGPIGFVSQSGAVGTAITALAHRRGMGVGYFLSTGNEGDLEFSDFCAFFAADPAIDTIAGYVESIRDGERFRAAAESAARAGKPVVLIKVGASEAGGRAVQSHTGALAGSDAVYSAAFEQLAVQRVQGIEDLIDALRVFGCYRPALARPGALGRVAVLSHSGGAGVLMADTCVAEGLEVPAPTPALAQVLAARLPAYAALGNPIDMTANVIFDPALMAQCVRDVAQSGEYDAVMLCVNLIWRQGAALAERLATLVDVDGAFVAVAWIAAQPEAATALDAAGVPVFGDPVRCVKAVAARLRWQARRDELLAAPSTRSAAAEAPSTRDLSSYAAQVALLRHHDVEMVQSATVADEQQALAAVRDLGYPIAAKLLARGLLHKSDVGGVVLDIDSDDTMRGAVARLLALPVPAREGVLLQPMVTGGLELIVGMQRDPVFGPVVVVGLGGIYVEVFRETVMRLAPCEYADAERLIRRARFFPLLDGARGQPRRDIAALARLVAHVSRLSLAEPAIESLDLNPVILGEAGVQVVDFKLQVRRCDD